MPLSITAWFFWPKIVIKYLNESTCVLVENALTKPYSGLTLFLYLLDNESRHFTFLEQFLNNVFLKCANVQFRRICKSFFSHWSKASFSQGKSFYSWMLLRTTFHFCSTPVLSKSCPDIAHVFSCPLYPRSSRLCWPLGYYSCTWFLDLVFPLAGFCCWSSLYPACTCALCEVVIEANHFS